MKRIVLLLLLLLPLLAAAQEKTLRLTKDSLPYNPDAAWLFSAQDRPAMAQPAYNDSGWKTRSSVFHIRHKEDEHNLAPCWFRLHFVADTSMVGKALSLQVEQGGASDIYLDGRLLMNYGSISDTGIISYNPQAEPLVFSIASAGPHVLAIRYANDHALSDYKYFDKTQYGFTLLLGNANDQIASWGSGKQTKAAGFLFLFGIFLAMGGVHLFLFLYYKAGRSNAYFSLFSFSISACFFIGFIRQVSIDPTWITVSGFIVTPVCAFAAWTFSGFLNELFSRKRIRFYTVSALALATIIIQCIDYGIGIIVLAALLSFVLVEALVLIIVAVYRRVKGAKIIALGMLVVILYCLVLLAALLVNGGSVELSNDNATGIIANIALVIGIFSVPLSMSAYQAWSFANVNKNLKTQLSQVQLLSAKTLEQEQEKQRMLENRQEELEQEVTLRTTEIVHQKEEIEKQHSDLKREKKKSDDLLLNILPAEVADELKEKGRSEARLYNEVTVLFTDFVNFTGMSEILNPSALVAEIDHCFQAFDHIITAHNLEKIKTIGDAYLAVSGLPVANPRHAQDTIDAAIAIRNFMLERKAQHSATFGIRLGVHSGPVVAGIVGIKKFAYDIWGDTVNTAARMEQHGEAGRINISGATYSLLKGGYTCTFRGELEAKNKGKMAMYFVEK